jgi:hypothetical protein
MFNEHALAIRDAFNAEENTQGRARILKGAALVVLLSIQQPWHSVGTQFADIQQHGAASRFLWGNKGKAWAFLSEHAERLADAIALAPSHEDAILTVLEVPGLGIVKASFLLQMLTGEGACLDLHNLDRLGLKRDAFKTPKSLKVETVRARIATYCATWRAQGKSRFWWDSWCSHVATVYPKHFADAEAVSALHTIAITNQQ